MANQIEKNTFKITIQQIREFMLGTLPDDDNEEVVNKLLSSKKNLHVFDQLLKSTSEKPAADELKEFKTLYQKPTKQEKQAFLNKIQPEKMFDIQHPKPVWFSRKLVAGFVIIALLAAIGLSQFLKKQSPQEAFVNHYLLEETQTLFDSLDDSPTIIRGMEPASRGNETELEQSLNKYLNYAAINLKNSDYPYAVGQYLHIINKANQIENLNERPQLAKIKGTAHFLLGITQLLQSQGKHDRDAAESSFLLDQANENLEKSIALARIETIQMHDQRSYFLALSQGMQGDRNSAITTLQNIPNDSPYFSKAESLIKKWQANQ